LTGKVDKIGGKLGKEGKVTLLAGGKRGTGFGNGSNEGFVISEKGEKSTFQEKTEVTDCEVGCQQFPVKGRVTGFSGRKLVGEKSERLPRTTCPLLQHSAHMGIRGVCGKGKDGRRIGMMEWNSRSQKGFCSLKGGIHGWGPLKRLLVGTGISERTQDMSNAWQETAIEIEHA
jgi:hypothetical protein